MAWETIDAKFGVTEAERLSYGNITGVNSVGGLEDTFNSLSQGETVLVHQPTTPYRTEQWLDIDVDGVTVQFESRFAANGESIIKPADGSDVGGIRLGYNEGTPSVVSDIEIRNFGFDGNEATMTDSVKRLHSIYAYAADGVVIDGHYATRTHPWEEHGTGGSGISVLDQCEDFNIKNCDYFEIGDRAIQFGGSDSKITNIFNDTGYDRTVAVGARDDGGVVNTGHDIQISTIMSDGTKDGSTVGVQADGVERIFISDVYSMNHGRGAALTCQHDGAGGRASDVYAEGLWSYNQTQGSALYVEDIDGLYVNGIVSIASADQALRIGTGSFDPNDVYINGVYIKDSGFDGISVDYATDDPGNKPTISNVHMAGALGGRGVRANTSAVINGLDVDEATTTGANIVANGAEVIVRDADYSDYADNATVFVLNGDADETETTGTPTGSYPPGTMVRTDGVYWVDRDGNTVLL